MSRARGNRTASVSDEEGKRYDRQASARGPRRSLTVAVLLAPSANRSVRSGRGTSTKRLMITGMDQLNLPEICNLFVIPSADYLAPRRKAAKDTTFILADLCVLASLRENQMARRQFRNRSTPQERPVRAFGASSTIRKFRPVFGNSQFPVPCSLFFKS